MYCNRGNYRDQAPFQPCDTCTACYLQTFGSEDNPGYKCVDQLCGQLYSLLCVLRGADVRSRVVTLTQTETN